MPPAKVTIRGGGGGGGGAAMTPAKVAIKCENCLEKMAPHVVDKLHGFLVWKRRLSQSL
jgi:hypothetical protein